MPAQSALPLSAVLSRLGIEHAPEISLQGLRELYRAWCIHVPADNIQKMIALKTGAKGQLPGTTAVEFFEHWLRHGTGGTCWAATNACYELFKSAGFDARRGTASVWDMETDNHGIVVVNLDGQDWLLDSSMHSMEPLPLVKGQVHIQSDPVYHVEIDPDGNTFYVWAVAPPLPRMIVFKILETDVPESVFHTNHERSREQSIFNERLYIRRNEPDRMIIFTGSHRYDLTAEGEAHTELTAAELLADLTGPFGYSGDIVDRWVACGALESSMQPKDASKSPPEVTRIPPSEREA